MRARAQRLNTTRHTRTRDLKPQARIRTRPKPCTRARASPSPASASVSICHERLGLVQDFDSQCSFIVPDHEDPIRHLRQGATQLVLCRVCNLRARVLGCCRLPSHCFWSCPKSIDQKLPRYDHGLALKSRPPAKSKEAQADRLARIEPKQRRNRLSTVIHKTNRHEGNKSVARRRLCLAACNMT